MVSRFGVLSAMARRRLALLALAVAVTGCAAKRHLTADQYFHDATENFRSGSLPVAIDEYRELLDQHPFSEYNEEAELKIAHAHYMAGDYPEAIVAFTDFQRRHPTSPHLPFVGYCLGMCYVQQMGTIDRDQSAAQNAEAYFVTVSRQYPDSPFTELAREELARCRENLAEHELYVANFYVHAGNEKAAEIRLLTMAARYGETPAAADGLLKLAKLYREERRLDNAVLAYQALTQLHPTGPQSVAAQSALKRLAHVDPPATADPLDLLLAANGRQRSTGTYETVTVQVPGLEPPRTAARRPSSVPGPALGPPVGPFGGGGPY
jgi:outer membrane protein assembly factor BamD